MTTTKKNRKNRANSLAVFPGTFDPITNGHINIIERTLKQFDNLIIAVSNHNKKKTSIHYR